MRRLPVYLIIDTSFSMRGEPIETVKNGIKYLISTLRKDPFALETVFISIITFNTVAQHLVPLTELYLFQFKEFEAKGKSALGAAIRLTTDRIQKEYIKTTMEQKGDWKPIIFLLTDGGSSDPWKMAAKELKKLSLGMIISCAAGKKSNISVLKSISDVVVQLDRLDAFSIKEFFKWVSASVSNKSKTIEVPSQENNEYMNLPPLPKEIKYIVLR